MRGLRCRRGFGALRLWILCIPRLGARSATVKVFGLGFSREEGKSGEFFLTANNVCVYLPHSHIV